MCVEEVKEEEEEEDEWRKIEKLANLVWRNER